MAKEKIHFSFVFFSYLAGVVEEPGTTTYPVARFVSCAGSLKVGCTSRQDDPMHYVGKILEIL